MQGRVWWGAGGDALWLPNTERPAWLDGSMPGDRGFDPLGLAKPTEYLQVTAVPCTPRQCRVHAPAQSCMASSLTCAGIHTVGWLGHLVQPNFLSWG